MEACPPLPSRGSCTPWSTIRCIARPTRLNPSSHRGLLLSSPLTLAHSSAKPLALRPQCSLPLARASTAAAVAAAAVESASAGAGVAAAPVAVLPVLQLDGAPAGEAELSLKTARPESAKGLVHRAVITFLQNKRRGTASTLTRAEVRGGGRKPYKQKGTGRARQGSTRTPLRPGGGVIFGPKPCDWTIKMNKKERQLAVGTALQSAAVNMTIVQDVDDKDFPLAKTRDFVGALERWGVDYKKDSVLFVTNQLTRNVELSCRNIQKLKVTSPAGLNIYDVLRADKLVVTLSGLAFINRKFGGGYEDEEEEDEGASQVVVMDFIDGATLFAEAGVSVEAEEEEEGDEEEGEEEGAEEGDTEGGDAE